MVATHTRCPLALAGRTLLAALALAAMAPACAPADDAPPGAGPPATQAAPASGDPSASEAAPAATSENPTATTTSQAGATNASALASPRPASPEPPAALVGGRDLFDLHCAECHGVGGFGSRQGPPLAHEVYRPGHHADISFHLAVQRGVRSHHWNFGDMPPLRDVPVDRIQEIVDYVRWVQRETGIR